MADTALVARPRAACHAGCGVDLPRSRDCLAPLPAYRPAIGGGAQVTRVLKVALGLVLGGRPATVGAALEPDPSPPTDAQLDRSPLDINVMWEAPTPCPTAAAFLDKVETLTGRALRFDADALATIEGQVQRGPDGDYHLELTTRIGEQREARSLHAPTCDAVVDASALVVALALEPHTSDGPSTAVQRETTIEDPDAEVPALPPTSAVAAESVDHRPLPPSVPADPRDASTPTAPPRAAIERARVVRPHAVLVLAEGAAALAQTTTLAAGVAGAVGWQRGRARIDLGARHWFRTRTTSDPGVRLSLTSGALRGCFVPAWGRVELPVCGGLEAGGMRARGRGTGVTPFAGTAAWFAMLAGMDVVVGLTPWLGVRARAEIAVAPSRPTFHVRAAEVDRRVYLAAPVNARLGLGLRARFSLGQ